MYRYSLTLTCALAVACGGGAPEPAAESAPAEVAEAPAEADSGRDGADFVMESAVIADGVLHLQGSGSLPDGALISYEIKHDGFDVGDYDGYETGQIELTGGAFTFEMSVEDWPVGQALISLTFEMQPSGDPQPAAVVEGITSPNAARGAAPKVFLSKNGTEEKPLNGFTILCCEDNQINRTVLRRQLDKEGCDEILLACDGKEGVDLFMSRKAGTIDCILMDIEVRLFLQLLPPLLSRPELF